MNEIKVAFIDLIKHICSLLKSRFRVKGSGCVVCFALPSRRFGVRVLSTGGRPCLLISSPQRQIPHARDPRASRHCEMPSPTGNNANTATANLAAGSSALQPVVARHSYSAGEHSDDSLNNNTGTLNNQPTLDSPSNALGLQFPHSHSHSADSRSLSPKLDADLSSSKPPLSGGGGHQQRKQSPSGPGEQHPFLVSPAQSSPDYEPKGWDGKGKRDSSEMEAGMSKGKQSYGRSSRRVWITMGLLLAAGVTVVAVGGSQRSRSLASANGLLEVADGGVVLDSLAVGAAPPGTTTTASSKSDKAKTAVHKDEEVPDLADRYAGSAHRLPGMLRPEEMKHEEDEHMGKDSSDDHEHSSPSSTSSDRSSSSSNSAQQEDEEDPEEEKREGQAVADKEEQVRMRHASTSGTTHKKRNANKRTKRSLVPRVRHGARQSNLETAFADSPGAELLQLASDDVPAETSYGKRAGKMVTMGKVRGKMTKEEQGLWVVENAES